MGTDLESHRLFRTVFVLTADGEDTYEVEPPPGPQMRVGQRFVYTPVEVRSPEVISGGEGREPSPQEREAHIIYEETRGEWFVREVYWELVVRGPGGDSEDAWVQHITLARGRVSRTLKR